MFKHGVASQRAGVGWLAHQTFENCNELNDFVQNVTVVKSHLTKNQHCKLKPALAISHEIEYVIVMSKWFK